ncbi:GH32 C-terminal domain-containing protein [Foetidibacter luteolus]|uniref:GH32 C-terminal domain-containing protein n=1 Tax=Foetidibacter luteolus TaxID=2608880 RepID=UPI00129B72C9|nr:GH32 C-terminal domain-containing protein [Foetidibacter luteolus]
MKKRLLTILLSASVITAAVAQSGEQKLRNLATYFTPEKKYLVLPVKNGAPKRNIELWADGDNVRFFDMELADDKPDWYAYLDISEWKGKPVELRVDKLPVDSKAFAPIAQSDEDKNAGEVYKEKLRAQFHFSPKRGWTNDPNGMAYFNGEYHLFFQHNPYGRGWGNMTWGHAVSKDMIHWTEVGDALHPDKFGPMFSGSAIVDSFNTSGLGEPGKPAMIMFFTGARSWAQAMAYTTDGRTFHKLDKAAVPRINKDNRDPKVIWHAPTKQWVMVLYVERDGGQHSMQFLTSPDLKNWTKTSSLNGGIGDDRYLFECPEFYELPVDGNPANKKWLLTAANSDYAIGSFDGKTFTPEAERLSNQRGRDFYAAQTFNNQPEGRRIEIGWWRTHTDKDDMTFNQGMSIPLEHKLVTTPEGIRLTRLPIKELEQLRDKTYNLGKLKLKEGGKNPLESINSELAEIRTELEPGKAATITFTLRGLPVVYDVAKQQLTIDGVTAPAALQDGKLKLIIYVDRTGVELFANDGLMFMPINKNLEAANQSYSLTATGGTVKVNNLDVYALKSIW